MYLTNALRRLLAGAPFWGNFAHLVEHSIDLGVHPYSAIDL